MLFANFCYADASTSSPRSRCQVLVSKIKTLIQDNNKWLRDFFQPSITRRTLGESAKLNLEFEAQWTPLLRHRDPIVAKAFQKLWLWSNSSQPQRLTQYEKPWFAYNPNRDYRSYHAAPIGKYRQFWVGNDSNLITFEVLSPSLSPSNRTIHVRIGFSSPIAAGIVGKLLESALHKTEMQRGQGLPLKGGTWELDFFAPHELYAANSGLHEREIVQKVMSNIFTSPVINEITPAINLRLPLAREPKGYEWFLANLIAEIENTANQKHKPELDSELFFGWCSSAYHDFLLEQNLLKISAGGDQNELEYSNALRGLTGSQALNGDQLYLLAEAMLPTWSILRAQGKTNQVNIQKHRFPQITQEENQRILDGQNVSKLYPQEPPE